MKISYNRLKEYIDMYLPYDELADMLTMAGIEVEDIKMSGEIPETVVTGEIIERKPHPNADKLSVCTVSTGKEKLSIVCGAPNCNPGIKAPLALTGTTFTDNESGKSVAIKKCKLRGVESHGMLCSAKELGLTTEECSGIMELPKDTVPGTPVKNLFPPDIIYDFEITPNRPDWLSHWGIAREIHALTGKELRFPNIDIPKPDIDRSIDTDNIVTVKDFNLCQRYTCRIIRGVTVTESPEWLKRTLINIGLRPINNIVDITNFVLHELGQPLHAFDYDLLKGGKIIVRKAFAAETITALDGKKYRLTDEHPVIADAERPVAIAGIMGGEDTGVTKKTLNILLESAYFNPSIVRKTSRELAVSSDSSYRFERGTDWNMVKTASDRATALILEIAGGKEVTGLIDIYKQIPPTSEIQCKFEKIRSLLGIDIQNQQITEIFQKLGMEVLNKNDEFCIVKPPMYRLDISREADLAEEVIRIYGLDNIPEKHIAAVCGGSLHSDAYLPIQSLANKLIACGLTECVTYTLTDKDNASAYGTFSDEDIISLSNPISADQAFLRASLAANMLRNVNHNIARKNYDLRLFEIGKVFCANPHKYSEEHTECCIALTGRKYPERFSAELEKIYDFFDIKGIIEVLCEYIGIKEMQVVSGEHPLFTNSCCAEIKINKQTGGYAGEVKTSLLKHLRLKYPLFLAVLNADMLISSGDSYKTIKYTPISAFPSTERDVAFITDTSTTHGEIVNFIKSQKLKFFEDVRLFDIFEDDKSIGKGKKSMAYRFVFRHKNRTLTDNEVNKEYEKIRKLLSDKMKVQLR